MEMETDDGRFTLDENLKNEVLLPLAERTGCDMKDLAFMCVALAINEGLAPRAAEKRDANNWHANPSEPLYRFIAELFSTNFPIRMASEFANAGLVKIRSRVQSEAEITDVFKLGN
jgi:hypothetical protein